MWGVPCELPESRHPRQVLQTRGQGKSNKRGPVESKCWPAPQRTALAAGCRSGSRGPAMPPVSQRTELQQGRPPASYPALRTVPIRIITPIGIVAGVGDRPSDCNLFSHQVSLGPPSETARSLYYCVRLACRIPTTASMICLKEMGFRVPTCAAIRLRLAVNNLPGRA